MIEGLSKKAYGSVEERLGSQVRLEDESEMETKFLFIESLEALSILSRSYSISSS